MITVILTACLVTQPMKCKDINIPILEVKNVTPWKCGRFGQLKAEEWAKDHPKWKIQRWACDPRDKNDKQIDI